MSHAFFCRAVLLLSLAAICTDSAASSLEPVEYKVMPGPYQVAVARYEWLDSTRDREIPVKIYYPTTGKGPFPVVIFSHGLGGSRENAEYLGMHWASHGYVSVHVQHHGSDDAVWKGTSRPLEAMRKALKDPSGALNRPRDVSFTANQLEILNREGSTLKGRLDLNRLGISGHSFGAFTALAIAGEVFTGPRGGELTLADPRFKAAIAMSAPVSQRQRANLQLAFGSIRIPCLHMTGTKDHSPIGETGVEHRRLPFDSISGADQFLITFADGDHMIFSGRRPGKETSKDQRFYHLIRMSSIAFWDAHLMEDVAARTWLTQGGFEPILGNDGKFEKKLVTSPR